MDRNSVAVDRLVYIRQVALRKESVDRNPVGVDAACVACPAVALRKESVDRNNLGARLIVKVKRSLSARRAWIEISKIVSSFELKEGRSPQGERG